MKLLRFILGLFILQQKQWQINSQNSSNEFLNVPIRFSILQSLDDGKYFEDLRSLLTEIAVHSKRCLAIITDEVHHPLYDSNFFGALRQPLAYFYVRIATGEDLLAPNYQTVRILHQIRAYNCEYNVITLLNGLQTKRFLRFIEKRRILNLQQKFLLLHDAHMMSADMWYIWSNMISTLLIKRLSTGFLLSIVAYPEILKGIVVTRRLLQWHKRKHINISKVFPDRTSNLYGTSLPVVVFEHIPMVARDATNNRSYTGLEIEILYALGAKLNFVPQFYETADAPHEHWGKELPNGSYTGVLGQMLNHSARIAIGNLHMYKEYANVMDLTWPHSFECLTFLTPESSQDHSWRTLIQPFNDMWTGVLLSLLLVGSVFYSLSYAHAFLLRRKSTALSSKIWRWSRRHTTGIQQPPRSLDPKIFRDMRFRRYLYRLRFTAQRKPDLFESFSNCLLLTYSMLMYVSLPRLPRSWSLRVLTGWYWIYCILLTVTYRASLTAILANPAARITIDTLEDLAGSRVTSAVWVEENKRFFENAFDEGAQKIGQNIELVQDINKVTELIVKGDYAYYDNEHFLRHLRLKGAQRREEQQFAEVVLHIMRECVIQMPVALGLEKNSPLKPNIDKNLLRLIEAGLIKKWLMAETKNLPAEERAPQEAVVNLNKIWSSFVALGIGSFVAICAVAGEKLHFKLVVVRHPLYDIYNTNLYYNFRRRFPNYAIKPSI